MTSQNAIAEVPVASAPSMGLSDETVTLETRFGVMEFQLENSLYMPRGMLGYADYHDYGLANMPDPKLEQFKVLQCLENPDLSFIVASLNTDGETIDPKDIRQACDLLDIDPQNTVVLLVVSTRRMGSATQISVNVRAPVIVDATNRKAYQYVLLNNRYPVRQIIGSAAQKSD